MRSKFHLGGALKACVIAAVVFLMAEMAMVALIEGQSPFGPPRMMAAIVMGRDVLPPPATFDLGIMTVAMMVHLALSVVLGIIWGLIHSTRGLSRWVAVGVAAVFGLLVYAVNFYGFTALFPWFEMARGTVSAVGHAIFGIALGWAYGAYVCETDEALA